MKKTSLSLTKIASAVGLFLGMFTLSVMAVNWTAASCPAPGCNTDAPINVGTSDQNKVGRLGVATTTSPLVAFEAGGAGVFAGDLAVAGKVITNGLMLKGTDYDKKGYVLTNDGNGNAGWTPVQTSQDQMVVCNWIGVKAVYGNIGGVEDDLHVTCDNGRVSRLEFGDNITN